MRSRNATAFLISLIVVFTVSPAQADDIGDAIAQAAKSYQSGDLNGAKQSLDMASQLIAHKNAEGLTQFLPPPLPGWKAEEAEANAPGALAMGGSIASRRYTKGDDEDVRITFSADSAILTQQIALFSNPQVAGMMGKLIPIAGQRAIQAKDGNLTLVIGNRIVVTIDGDKSQDMKIAYAKAIDYGRLAQNK